MIYLRFRAFDDGIFKYFNVPVFNKNKKGMNTGFHALLLLQKYSKAKNLII